MAMPATDLPDKVMGLSGFLQFLYGGFEEGYVYAPTLDRESGEFKQVFVSVGNLPRLEQHIRESSEHTDVYLSPAVFKSTEATKQGFLASNVAWCEFDGNSPASFEMDPSVIIQSSLEGHTHCYWRLNGPEYSHTQLEKVNRALAYGLDADKSGWDANQILRPPESQNYKRDLPVQVLSVTGNFYELDDFDAYKVPELIEESSIKLHNVPDVMDVVYDYALGKEFKNVFTGSPKEGERSSYYMRVGYIAAEKGCSNEELFALLSNFDSRIGKYNKRQDRTRRLLDIIERVRSKYPEQIDEGGIEAEELSVYGFNAFLNAEFTVEWLIPDFLQENGALLIAGPPGVGKSQLSLNFAIGLALGEETLGLGAEQPCRVLFMSAEMGPGELDYILRQMGTRYNEEQLALLDTNLLILPHGEPFYLNSSEGQKQLQRLTDEFSLDGIVFDSLGSATTKSLSDEEATKSLLDFLDRYRKNYNVFTWFVHHTRKASENNKEPSDLQDIFGSQYITARSSTVLSLWPQPEGVLKVRELKKRLAPEAPDWYIKRTESGLGFNKVAAPAPKTVTKRALGKAVSGDDSPAGPNPYGI